MNSQALVHAEQQPMRGTDLRWQAAATGVSQRFYRARPTSWRRLLTGWRPSFVLAIAALLAVLGLLATFQHVVAGAVSQGAVARKAALADTSWRTSTRGVN